MIERKYELPDGGHIIISEPSSMLIKKIKNVLRNNKKNIDINNQNNDGILKKKRKFYIDKEIKEALTLFKEEYICETENKKDLIPYNECIDKFMEHFSVMKEKENIFRKGGYFSKLLKELFSYSTVKIKRHYFIEKIKWKQKKEKNIVDAKCIVTKNKTNNFDNHDNNKNRKIKKLSSFEELIEKMVPYCNQRAQAMDNKKYIENDMIPQLEKRFPEFKEEAVIRQIHDHFLKWINLQQEAETKYNMDIDDENNANNCMESDEYPSGPEN